MFYVYAISSTTHNYIYVGITDNLLRRVDQHQKGYNRTTKPYRPFILIYFEKADDRKHARSREKHFKTAAGKRKLKLLVSRLMQ
ncbi:MAG: GIY-YIG nuclease family protein [Bacteroidales bacterium]|nr:GIY-YIG nuclease family protein [Bacteroidales bacterium]MBN2763649.1 GIY-YIG nuclease family protein [Bacteroidales bacterium]